ncbi:DUF1097 domain-containing protein [Streptomyces poriferorum]|uniref:DUF1097 domain-containing protein n=1 Tax=Streptomyces TaxID=1883 RepID=UPI00273DC2EF|nr:MULTISPECIES: DUF1097 domain-containing protein [unclassified Streptomyces]WLQ46411.1 DUF1097 domain-containing protein [Streptomyces sp. Alt1]WRZ02664.1 DUF1097 domain-containing protein [Streptomyces sp. NBC_00385]WSI61746.1 DUF1097 domain-containing protein [Streptomyces sp. NBC_01336]WSQ47818.1 DUF1097 domain-containing protein [Streptomyces sp. NBC_01220]
MRERIPHELTASVLAATTAFVGGTALNLPPWAIFISWAGLHLMGGPSLANATRLWRAMPVGSAFALAIVVCEQHLAPHVSEARWAQNALLGAVILVLNTALMYSGRLRATSLVPGMFLGFASYFATYFGGFGYEPGNVWAAWLSVVAMNALGPVYAYLAHRLTLSRPAPAVEFPAAAAEVR